MCAVYFCGTQNVYELQKIIARDDIRMQRRKNRLTVTTSAMVIIISGGLKPPMILLGAPNILALISCYYREPPVYLLYNFTK